MSTEQQVATLMLRIRQCESETERWRAAGPREKYLESFCNGESLERELDALLREGQPAGTGAPASRG